MTSAADIPHDSGLLRVLRKVHSGHVTVCGPNTFLDDGRPFPGMLVPFLRELFGHEQVRLGEQHESGLPLVVMSGAGEELFAELDEGTEQSISDGSS